MILDWISKKLYALSNLFDRWYARYWNWRWRMEVEQGKAAIASHLFLEGIKVKEWDYRLNRYGVRDWSYWLTAWVSEEDYSWDVDSRVSKAISREWFFNTPDRFLECFMYDIRAR